MTINDVHAPETTTAPTPMEAARRLRLVLRVNAVSSGVSGLLLTIAPETFADLLEVDRPGWVRIVGLALLPFAAFVAWLSTSSIEQLRRHTPGVVAGDIGWVVASIVTLLLGWYGGVGIALVIGMAVAVDTFAFLQWRAWRRLATPRGFWVSGGPESAFCGTQKGGGVAPRSPQS